MANNASTIKRIRQDLKRRDRNRARISSLRTAMKKVRVAVAEGRLDDAREALPGALRELDQNAQAGAIHRNSAARRKSRLTRLVQNAEAS